MMECECCKTAREFVEKLDLSQAQWSYNNWSSDWIFRGQADAKWPLVPAALRIDQAASDEIKTVRQSGIVVNRISRIMDDFSQVDESGNLFDLLVQLYAEITNLRDFFDLADRLNLSNSIPLLSEFYKYGTDFINEYLEHINQETYLLGLWGKPYIAIAQHHGVATRLLDWTKNPLYAAHFACEGIKPETTEIAVYATRAPSLNDDIRLIEVSNRHSPYIQAQEGIFTLDTKADVEFLKTGKWRSMENVPHLLIRKFTLKASEVSELSRILWLKQITRAHMMPTLDNVILALKKKWEFQLEEHQKILKTN